jgi:hypothetical protein
VVAADRVVGGGAAACAAEEAVVAVAAAWAESRRCHHSQRYNRHSASARNLLNRSQSGAIGTLTSPLFDSPTPLPAVLWRGHCQWRIELQMRFTF